MSRYLFLFLTCTLVLVSCKDDDSSFSDPETEVIKIEYDLLEKVQSSTYFAGDFSQFYMMSALKERFVKNESDIGNAQVIVIESQSLGKFRDAIKKAWEEGRTIVELFPNNATHCNFWNSINAPVYLDVNESTNDLILLAVNRYSCYQLQSPFLSDSYSARNKYDDIAISESPDDNSYNFESRPVEINKTSEFMNTKLFSLVRWVNSVKAPNAAEGIPTFDGNLSNHIEDKEFSQHYTKSINIGTEDFQLCKVTSSKPDLITRHSTIELNVYITPFYAYSSNKNNGDYYFVTMDVTSHNAQLYGVYSKKHGQVRTYAHAFYSKDIAWETSLVDSNNKNLGSEISFFETPHPTTTVTSEKYTTGYTSKLNINGQGGVLNGAPMFNVTVGSEFTWDHSLERTVTDQSIIMSTDPITRRVDFNYQTGNLHKSDDTSKAIPAIARSDQKCEGSWCWRVSNTKDNDTNTRFKVKINLKPIYGWMYRHATWTCEGNERSTKDLINKDSMLIYIDLLPPNRILQGILDLKCTSTKEYMANIRILQDTTVVVENNKAYSRDSIARFQLPVGRYTAEYEIRNGDTGKLKWKKRISNIAIEPAATTECNSFEGTNIN